MNINNNFRSPLARAKGYGTAGSGSKHWWNQRLSAIMLIFLSLSAIYIIINIVKSRNDDILLILQAPANILVLVLFALIMMYHSFLGLEMVITDYVHQRCSRIIMQITLKIYSIVTAVAFVLSMIYVMNL